MVTCSRDVEGGLFDINGRHMSVDIDCRHKSGDIDGGIGEPEDIRGPQLVDAVITLVIFDVQNNSTNSA